MSSISGISGYMNYAYTQALSSAQEKKGSQDLLTKIDTDESGTVSQTELDAFTTEMSEVSGTTVSASDAMTAYDEDGDGELSSTELESFLEANKPEQPPMGMMGMGMPQGPSPEEKFSEADSDSSGGLSQTELDTLVADISQATGSTIDTTDAISTYDADGDGELSSDEVQSFLDASGVKPSGPPPMMGQTETDDDEDSSSDDLLSLLTDNAVSTYDTDGDGTLSSTELKSFLSENLSNLSSDYIFKALSAYTGMESSSSLSLEA